MRRTAVFIFLVVLLPLGAASTFDTVLYTDDLTEDLRITGAVWPDYQRQGVDTVFKYQLEIVNDGFNGTKVDSFHILVRNGSGVVTRKQVSTENLVIEDGLTEPRYARFTIPVRPDRVTGLRFRLNHTAVLTSGEQVFRRLQGGISLSLQPPNQTLDSFSTNVSEAFRDRKIWVTGETSGVDRVTIQGSTFQVEAGRFQGRVPLLPDDLTPGPEEIPYMIETSTGLIFQRNVTTTIVNRRPSINLSSDASTVKGEPLPVTVQWRDDTGIATVSYTFRGETFTNASSTFNIATTDLSVGDYTFNVSVTDHDGATATANASFTVKKEQQGGNGSDGGSEGRKEQSSSIPIIGPIRDFIEGLIRSLLGIG